MKIKVVAHTSDEEGVHFPGEVLDMRTATAEQWILRGWAIRLPADPKPEEAVKEKRVIETPEDAMPAPENASLKRKKK